MLEVVGIWIASIGTVAAVVVALWLAQRDRRPSLELRITHVLMISGYGGPTPEFISVRITNKGIRPATIEGIGWRSGWFVRLPFLKRKEAIQRTDLYAANPSMPIELADGDVANFLIPVVLTDGSNWYYGGITEMVQGRFDRWTFRGLAWTTRGEMIVAKPNDSFFNHLDEAITATKTKKEASVKDQQEPSEE